MLKLWAHMIFKSFQIRAITWKALLLLNFFYALSTTLSSAQTELDTIPKVEVEVDKFPVVFFTDTLFYISTNLGPYTAAERAASQSNKLAMLLENDALDTTLLKSYNDTIEVEIMHGKQIISTITQADAKIAGKDKEMLAAEHLKAIKPIMAKKVLPKI